ncbi:MAG: glycosyltransferase family 4 protein [Chloroflexia bacterium]
MRILHVIYDDVGNPWLGGGGATRTQEIYGRIALLGHRVTVVCANYPGAARSESRRGVTYRHIGLTTSYALSRLSFMPGAARLARAGGYDIVVEDVSPYSPVGVPLWAPKCVPAVASVQNLSGAHATGKYRLVGWGPRLVERPLLSRFRYYVAVAPGIARQLRHKLGGDIQVRVVPNSVGDVFYSHSQASGSPGAPAPPYVLFLGRIDIYQKGLDRLVPAFDLAAERIPGLKLVIAGGGVPSQEKKLSSLVAAARHRERVQVLGSVDTNRAAELMKGALLLAMPSRYEAWPLTALEAGAAGVPVVGSDIAGVNDAAPPFPKAHGLPVPQADVPAFADAFARLADNPGLRAKMGERGRLWARRFTWDALAEAQLEFYEQIVQAR